MRCMASCLMRNVSQDISLGPAVASRGLVTCGGTAIGAIESIATLLYDLADLADGEISSTCETLVASLEGKGTGEIEACDTNQLCAALGPLAMPCDVVFVGICVMNAGNAANPCQWLIDEAGGNPAAICTQLEQQMGLLPADDGGGH